jgi:hypothetical protein
MICMYGFGQVCNVHLMYAGGIGYVGEQLMWLAGHIIRAADVYYTYTMYRCKGLSVKLV